jgi:hypothetical protein
METKTCGECKHLNRELAFCRACGAKWLNENDGASCKYFEKITPPTNGDKIRKTSKNGSRKTARSFGFSMFMVVLLKKYIAQLTMKEELSLATVSAPKPKHKPPPERLRICC